VDSVLGELFRINKPEYERRAAEAAAPFKARHYHEVVHALEAGTSGGASAGAGAGALAPIASPVASPPPAKGRGKRKAADVEVEEEGGHRAKIIAAAIATASAAGAAGAGAGAGAGRTGAGGFPERLVCPLTQRLFINPVITPAGWVYERDALASLLSSNGGVDPKRGGEALKLADCEAANDVRVACEQLRVALAKATS
jgi:hypothetical protein